ncbi:MAG: hypothetical protein AAF512_02910 [Pseudomonadota bacterium]
MSNCGRLEIIRRTEWVKKKTPAKQFSIFGIGFIIALFASGLALALLLLLGFTFKKVAIGLPIVFIILLVGLMIAFDPLVVTTVVTVWRKKLVSFKWEQPKSSKRGD